MQIKRQVHKSFTKKELHIKITHWQYIYKILLFNSCKIIALYVILPIILG